MSRKNYLVVDTAVTPRAKDIVLAMHKKQPIFRLFFPPYLYALPIGKQEQPLVVDNIITTLAGVVRSRFSLS